MPHAEIEHSDDLIRPLLPRPCRLSLDIAFNGPNYLTEKFK